jgi:SAM-dependent methyltransferase
MNITATMKEFYEETPFPNYKANFTLADMEREAKQFARTLREQAVGPIVEFGCGTGQLSNYLSVKHEVYGVDMCENSLNLARRFRDENNLSATFIQSDLFEAHRVSLLQRQFPLVVCNGVLHCTKNPYEGFQEIARFVQPGGHILIGLYNRYGRIRFFVKKWLVLKGLWPWAVPCSTPQEKAWFMDQYMIPHETTHTISEVAGWFRKNGFAHINTVPPAAHQLFEERETSLFWTQLRMFLVGESFFFMVGRKL